MIAVTATAPRPSSGSFAPFHRWDRNFFLAWVIAIWIGVVMGFGGEIVHKLQTQTLSYPLIVHIHAAAMVGWLILLTTQVSLIRAGRADLHRRLGVAGVALGAAVILLGPLTAITVHALEFGKPDAEPQFLSVQLSDILAFAGLAGAALLLRTRPSAHKRLMLLATLYISDAGFARWLGGPIHGWLGDGFWSGAASLYLANDLLILGLGAYDLITRRRLHGAYVAGLAWVFGLQLTALWLLQSPGWKAISLRLIGH